MTKNLNSLKSKLRRGIFGVICLSTLLPYSALAATEPIGFPSVASNDSGDYMAIWSIKPHVMTSYSPDKGATWTRPTVLGTHSLEFPRGGLSVVHAGSGVWVAQWADTPDYANFTLYTSRSTDGVNWSAPATVSSDMPLAADMRADGEGTILKRKTEMICCGLLTQANLGPPLT